jgi:hypothetical protein
VSTHEGRVRGAVARFLSSRVMAGIIGVGLVLAAVADPCVAAEASARPENAAGEPTVLGSPEALASALSRLKPGRLLRIVTIDAGTGEGWGEGRFGGVREGRLILEPSEIAKRLPNGVPLETVKKAWVRGRGTDRGAIIGATVGAAMGAFAGGGMAMGYCSVPAECLGEAARTAVLSGLINGAGFGIVGMLVGSLIPQWHPLPVGSAGGTAATLGPTRGSIRPYAVIAPAASASTSPQGHVGGLGGGVQIDTPGPLSFGVEARWHAGLAREAAFERRPGALSLTAGATYRW